MITNNGEINIEIIFSKITQILTICWINATVRKMVNERLNGFNENNIVGLDDLISGFSPDCICLDKTDNIVKIGEGIYCL